MPSTKDTAAMLGISRQRVLALIQSGTLNAIVTDKGYSAVHFRRRGFYPSGFFVALILVGRRYKTCITSPMRQPMQWHGMKRNATQPPMGGLYGAMKIIG